LIAIEYKTLLFTLSCIEIATETGFLDISWTQKKRFRFKGQTL